MATDSYLVYRWAHTVSSSNNVVGITVAGGSGATSSIGAADYVNEGDVSDDDFIAAFETSLQDAYANDGGTGTDPTVTLNADGTVSITGGSDALTIDWTTTNGVQNSTLGFTSTATTVLASTTVTSPRQASNQWHPGISHVQWSRGVRKQNRFGRRNLNGEPYYLVHGTRNDEQVHTYDLVAGARIFDGLAALAPFAGIAGIATGEPNTLENFLAYALQTGSKSFYVYEYNDPSSHTRHGPFKLIDEGDFLEGFDPESYVQSHSSPHFPVRLMLWEV